MIIGKQYETSENYEKFSQMIQEKQISVKILGKGDEINLDSHTKLKVLWPTNSFITDNPLNNNAFVFQLLYRNRSILFCGDIEKEAEAEMLKQIKPEALQADILKVAHHGSKTSTTNEFLNKVKPKIALIGVGKDNMFGHPSNTTIEKLEKMNIKIYRTDLNAEISICVNDKGQVSIKSLY